jgi:tetraacyldisaccharide 4'-kinase
MTYARLAALRLARAPREKVDVPILRIGDFAVGVTGKTQTAMAFARAAKALGHRPGILCPGPSGFGSTPHMVDTMHDSARHVGEAAIEMASAAPVAVSSDRASAARMLAGEGCDLVIMPDGAAHRLRTHFNLLVVEASRGLGNGSVMPAGPLRAGLTDQIRRADALLRIGDGPGAAVAVRSAARAARPVYEAGIVAINGRAVSGRRLLAFAAVKDPGGFFASVASAGGEIVARRVFAEGHHFSSEELTELLADAVARDAGLVTTRRDAIRLRNGEHLPEGFPERLTVLDMAVEFELDTTAPAIIAATFDAWNKKRTG